MLHQFIVYLETKGSSPRTIDAYTEDVRAFLNYMALLSEDQKNIKEWAKTLKGKPATINRRISAVKAYYAFCTKFKLLDVNPADSLAFRRKSKRLPKFTLSQIPTSDHMDQAAYAALTLLSETGIRLAELCSLQRHDVGQNTIKVTGKGNKERIIPISPKLSALLSELKPTHPTLLFDLKRHQVQYLTRKHIGCNPHTLRHSFATTLINAGAPLLAIKDLLGHASVSATEVYTHLDYERLKKVHEKCHPKA